MLTDGGVGFVVGLGSSFGDLRGSWGSSGFKGSSLVDPETIFVAGHKNLGVFIASGTPPGLWETFWEGSKSALGVSWAPLGIILGAFWRHLRACWG